MFQPCACGWGVNAKTSASLVLSCTCACAQVHSCVTDACLLSLSDRAVAVFVFLPCTRPLRQATDSHDHIMAQVRSKKIAHFHFLSVSIQKRKNHYSFCGFLSSVHCIHVTYGLHRKNNNNHTHATVRCTRETFVTSDSRVELHVPVHSSATHHCS